MPEYTVGDRRQARDRWLEAMRSPLLDMPGERSGGPLCLTPLTALEDAGLEVETLTVEQAAAVVELAEAVHRYRLVYGYQNGRAEIEQAVLNEFIKEVDHAVRPMKDDENSPGS